MAAISGVAPLDGNEAHAAFPDRALTILIPCLNEAETIGICVAKAAAFLLNARIPGEVLVADNGSTDGSQTIAKGAGARVIHVETRGYGAALAAGISAAAGTYVIMADADDSYDLCNVRPFFDELSAGADLVMGNRFRGGIEKGAMPWLHRYFGNPILSALGRLLFTSRISDFHCGLRGFRRSSVVSLKLSATGMEYASEMVVRASLAGMNIVEVPTVLRKDGRSRAPHLRTWRDGWRHLRFLLLHSPRWTFAYPGMALITIGAAGVALLAPGPIHLTRNISLDVHTFIVACITVLIGTQSLTFGLIMRRYAERTGLLPKSFHHQKLLDEINLETFLQIALVLFLAGVGGIVWSVYTWSLTGFGELAHNVLRLMIASTCGVATALQLVFSAFLLGMLDLPIGDARGQQSGLTESVRRMKR
jgi:hypothetical protein